MGGSGGSVGVGGGILDTEGCPRKFESPLVDILNTGNIDEIVKLEPGKKLTIDVDQDAQLIMIKSNGLVIGYLPPNRSNIISCLSHGWSYTATIKSNNEDKINPIVVVLVIGFPNK